MNEYNNLNEQYDKKDDAYYSWSRSEMFHLIPQDTKRLLDVGCGRGGFGRYVKSQMPNVEVWGIEPDKNSAQIAATVLDKSIVGFFEDGMPELQNEQFDLICFNDVLEHILNPIDILTACKNYLTSSGKILSSIPNILYYPVFYEEIILEQDWHYRNAGTLDNTHVRFYTRKSIERLYQEAGYKIEKMEGINPFTSPKYRRLSFWYGKKVYDWRFLQFGTLAAQ